LKGLTARLLIFNLLLAVFPVGAVLFLGTYETQLLESQERAMVQQGRILASALAGHDLKEEAHAVLERLRERTDARLRVVDDKGHLLADSARPEDGENEIPGEAGEETETSYPEENVIYRIGALPTRTYKTITGYMRPPQTPGGGAEYYSGQDILDGPEIEAALEGRYGAATRISRGQKSVTLYSAIPVFRDEEVIGAVLVSRSTFSILSDLYQLRLDIAIIFLFSVGAAIILSILLARTVTVPVGRLRDQAESILDERGKLQAGFKPLSGRDEVADLSRALFRLSSRLQQRTDHMEAFMADLVHEMKNPIAGILSAAELAEQTAGKETLRFLDVIDREGRRIQRLLDDLRELISVDVRLDKGGKENVETGTLLKNLVSAYPHHRRTDVEITFIDESGENPEDKVFTAADPDRLAQAVLNLVDNAVSFSPENGRVEIRLKKAAGDRSSGAKTIISIADRGPGISPEDTGKVFERWYSDRPEEEASDHTGLGLAIVKGIVEGYGGRISIRSRKGGGTIFLMEFPNE